MRSYPVKRMLTIRRFARSLGTHRHTHRDPVTLLLGWLEPNKSNRKEDLFGKDKLTETQKHKNILFFRSNALETELKKRRHTLVTWPKIL